MVGHGGSSSGSYLADPTSPIPSHCASIVVTSTLRVNLYLIVMSVTVFFNEEAGYVSPQKGKKREGCHEKSINNYAN